MRVMARMSGRLAYRYSARAKNPKAVPAFLGDSPVGSAKYEFGMPTSQAYPRMSSMNLMRSLDDAMASAATLDEFMSMGSRSSCKANVSPARSMLASAGTWVSASVIVTGVSFAYWSVAANAVMSLDMEANGR